jgi:ATP-dependent Clp protease ATP-binding subunit ClpA
MGVTKPAARQRFLPRNPGDATDPDAHEGFSRFTPRAKNVVMAAHHEAHESGDDQIRPVHLVLGLLSEPQALATKAITSGGTTRDAVSEAAHAALPPAVEDRPALVPYGPDARKTLELTFREALRLGHNYIGTEHSCSRSWRPSPTTASSPRSA